MTIKPDKKFIRSFEYAGFRIYIQLKSRSEKALEFYLLNSKGEITKETIWIPKSSIQKEGNQYYGLDWLFDEYENQNKLKRIGYWL